MNRRTRTIIVVAIAAALASLASFGVYRAIQRIPVREIPIAERHMVVAKDVVPVGVLLTKDHVRLAAWPADAPVPGGFGSVDEVIGRGVVSAFVANEPVIESKLASRESGGGLPPMIPAGMRALSVKVNDVIGVAGYTVPGTRVDVIVVARAQSQNDTVARAVLHNIQVLTAGTKYDVEKEKSGQPIPTTVVTLLVTPRDAERLTLASTQGQIMLSLRNPLDVAPVETNGVRMAALLGAPDPAPVKSVVRGQPRMITQAPPPPPKPYTVEAIRGASRTQEIIKK